jgi:hypothetical protein
MAFEPNSVSRTPKRANFIPKRSWSDALQNRADCFNFLPQVLDISFMTLSLGLSPLRCGFPQHVHLGRFQFALGVPGGLHAAE